MREIKLLANETVLQNVESILEENGLELQSIFNVMLKKIDREKSIGFLFGQNLYENDIKQRDVQSREKEFEFGSNVKMSKTIAKKMFSLIENNVTYASKNKGVNHYWANPLCSCLKNDWYLILNDWQARELHLFKVPAFSLYAEELVVRADKIEFIDLQIAYNDPDFTDTRSGIRFKPFFVKTIKY